MIKKFTILLSCLFFVALTSNSQIVRASIDTDANNANAITIWLQSDLTTPQDTGISTMQFCIALPDTFSGVIPTTFTIDSCAWNTTDFSIGLPYYEGGFICYPIYNINTLMANFTANVDKFAMRLIPVGGAALPKDFYLICLPDGGVTDGTGLFYVFGAWYSVGNNLFYDKGNNSVSNGLSYDLVNAAPGTTTSWVKINIIHFVCASSGDEQCALCDVC